MKKIISVCFFAALSYAGFAQQQVAVSTTADPIVNSSSMDQYDFTVQQYYDRLDAERFGGYKLTDQQREQIKAMDNEYYNNLSSLNNNKDLPADQLRAKRYAMRNERRQRYLDMLSETDQQSYLSYLNDWNNNYVSMYDLKTSLNLTDDQYNKLNELNNSYITREVAIINNKNLNDADRTKQMNALSKERYSTYKALLSADQVTKFEHKNNGTWKIKTKSGSETRKIKTKG